MSNDDVRGDELERLAEEVLTSLDLTHGPRSRHAAPEGEVEVFHEDTGWFSLDDLGVGKRD